MSPTPYFRSRMAFSISDVAAMVGLQFQGLSIPIGDESVIAVVGEEGKLGTGRGLHPAYDEPSPARRRAHSERGRSWSPPRRRRLPSDS